MSTKTLKSLAWVLMFAVAAPAPSWAQSPPAPAAGQPAAAIFKQEELDQIVAPIALYPDPLLAQVLMASTYPLEIVQADRWVKQNPKVTGKALEDAMQKQPWDPSVKSLTALPQVLAMLSEKLDLTQKLGDAFLADQAKVMQTVQSLRTKANASGNLKSSKEQTVTSAQEGSQTVIKIEPADPQVVYVPTYNPAVVYGTWPYPAYPPYYYYPPGYVPGAALFTFAVGVAVGSALWGGCNWGGNNVYINHNNYNNFNRTNIGSGNSNWQHKPEHRKGVAYRDQATQQRYDRAGANTRDVQSRDQFRGRDAGPSAGTRDVGAGDRGGPSAGTRDVGAGDRSRDAHSGGNRGGFEGVDRGAQTRDVSQRGNQSLNSGGLNRGSAGARPSAGGGGRAGGGARAGGGGRGGRR
ncbi:MAG: DUF3300 domain-containing protein [Burkholderiales bacterium]